MKKRYNKNIIGKVSLIFIFFITISVHASDLDCSDVDGMAIFGYDYDEWRFIGAIANEYDRDSIANEYGAGNEYSSDSIFNDYGDFGSEYSSESAFNDYASNPPIIINDDYEFVGYLTINDYKTSYINTYKAINCAKDSYISFDNSSLKNITFKEIPGASSVSGLSSILYHCMNTYGIGTTLDINTYKCICSDGYKINKDKTKCVKKDGCKDTVNGFKGDDGDCYCKTGYEWSNKKDKCIKRKCEIKNSYRKSDGKCYCSNGYYFSEKSKSCESLEKYCSSQGKGIFYNTDTKKCDQCLEGTYKRFSNSNKCVPIKEEETKETKKEIKKVDSKKIAEVIKNFQESKNKTGNSTEQKKETKTTISDNSNKFSGVKCSADLIMSQNLRAPKYGQKYIRNGKYDGYTKGTVKEAHILQKYLNRLGFSAGTVDGIIGPKTRGAIMRLQKYLGTTQDGYVGPKTRALLNYSCK